MRSFILLFSFATIVRAAFSPTHVPLNVSSIELLGIETDDANNQVINHDGGGGGSQAGYHVQIFADSYTTGSFVHNSMAYIGYRNASDPTDMYTFGMGGTAGSKNFKAPFVGPIPNSNESALGPYFAIWAYTGLAALPDNKTLVGVFPAINESNTNFATFYSTMVTIDVVDPTNITSGGYPGSKRITPQLFYPEEVNYGSFASHVNDGYLHLVGADDTGFKLARVAPTVEKIGDRNHYSYFNGSSRAWQATPMPLNDNSTNFSNWTGSFLGYSLHAVYGDLFFSSYHNTYLLVFCDNEADDAVRVSYSTTGKITGEWTEPKTVYSPPVPPQCTGNVAYNYAMHAHPGLDTTGKTLVVSWSSCATYVSMARIHWA